MTATLTHDRADELSRAFVALYKAIDWPTFGSDRDRDLYLCEAVGALDRAGEHALADRVAAAVSRTAGDGRDLDGALAEINDALDRANVQAEADAVSAALHRRMFALCIGVGVTLALVGLSMWGG